MIGYFVFHIYVQPTNAFDDPNAIDLGVHVFSVSNDDITLEQTATNVNIDTLATRLGGAASQYKTLFIGPSSTVDDTLASFKYSLMLTVTPHVIYRNLKNAWSSNMYWKLVHESSGYYAVSVTATNDVPASYYLYNDQGTRLGTGMNQITGSNSYGSPTPASSSYLSFCTATFNEQNQITSISKVALINVTTSSLTQVSYRCKQGTSWSSNERLWYNVVMGLTPPTPPGGSDPYEEIPESGPGGGDGDPDFTSSDVVDYPVTPVLSAVSTGFTSLWCPTEKQMSDLATYLWNSDILTTSFWKKIFSNPLDSILGLNIVPLTLVKDGTDFVCLGGLNTWIRMDYLDSQFVEIPCGEIDLVETWGAYLDYDPYTRLEIYLPYCGTYPLKIDDFMPGKISVLYKADLITGACVAMIKSTKSDEHGDTLEAVMYQFTGNIATSIPVTATQFTNVVRSAISFVAGTGQRIASAYSSFSSGVATTALATPEDTSFITKNFKPPKNNTPSSTNPSEIMSGKPTVMRSGLIGSACGLLSIQTPYLILTRPRQARPKDQNIYTGYPSFITETLGDLSGYTEVESIHLEGIPCTAQELNEIDELLKGGVIF